MILVITDTFARNVSVESFLQLLADYSRTPYAISAFIDDKPLDCRRLLDVLKL